MTKRFFRRFEYLSLSCRQSAWITHCRNGHSNDCHLLSGVWKQLDCKRQDICRYCMVAKSYSTGTVYTCVSSLLRCRFSFSAVYSVTLEKSKLHFYCFACGLNQVTN